MSGLRFNSALTGAILFFFAGQALSVEVTEAWVARYNGDGNQDDKPAAVLPDGNGGCIVTGRSMGNGSADDYCTINYAAAGEELWVSRFASSPGYVFDWAWDMAPLGEGGVCVTGCCRFSQNVHSWDIGTLRYDDGGDTEWMAFFEGPDDCNDFGLCVAADEEGNVYVAGNSDDGTGNDFLVVKYNASGLQLWTAVYNGTGQGEPVAMALDGDGNVLVTGGISYGNGSNFATVKFSGGGQFLWAAVFDNPEGGVEEPTAIAVDAEGNSYVTGSTGSPTTGYDYATVSYSPEGDLRWEAFYGSTYGSGCANDIALDGSGNVYVTGSSGYSNKNFVTVSYNNDGEERWVSQFDGPVSGYDCAVALALDVFGNVFVTGYCKAYSTGYDFATVGYDSSSGQELWSAMYEGPYSNDDQPADIAVDDSGNLFVTGYSHGGGTYLDYATIKYVYSTSVDDGETLLDSGLRISPNPVVSACTMVVAVSRPVQCRVCVFGLDGRLVEQVFSGMLSSGEHAFQWIPSGAPSGVYLVRVSAGDTEETARMVVLR
jgi:hypothetical protein